MEPVFHNERSSCSADNTKRVCFCKNTNLSTAFMRKTTKLRHVEEKVEDAAGILRSGFCCNQFTMCSGCAVDFINKLDKYVIDACKENSTPNFIGTIAKFASLNTNHPMYFPAGVTCPSCCIIQLDGNKDDQNVVIKTLDKRSLEKNDYTNQDRPDLILKHNLVMQQQAKKERERLKKVEEEHKEKEKEIVSLKNGVKRDGFQKKKGIQKKKKLDKDQSPNNKKAKVEKRDLKKVHPKRVEDNANRNKRTDNIRKTYMAVKETTGDNKKTKRGKTKSAFIAEEKRRQFKVLKEKFDTFKFDDIAGMMVLMPYFILVPSFVGKEIVHAVGKQRKSGESSVFHAVVP